MERDGISKACTTKVIMKSPETSTEAIPEIDSGKVSLGLGSFFFSLFFLNKDFTWIWAMGRSSSLSSGPRSSQQSAISTQPIHIPICEKAAKNLATDDAD